MLYSTVVLLFCCCFYYLIGILWINIIRWQKTKYINMKSSNRWTESFCLTTALFYLQYLKREETKYWRVTATAWQEYNSGFICVRHSHGILHYELIRHSFALWNDCSIIHEHFWRSNGHLSKLIATNEAMEMRQRIWRHICCRATSGEVFPWFLYIKKV